MTEPTQEQIGQLWKWCGLIWGRGGGWFDRENKEYLGDNLLADLNNLFKYAVPVVIKKLRKNCNIDGGFWTESRAIHYLFQAWEIEYKEHKDFKDALFWVVRKVLNGE